MAGATGLLEWKVCRRGLLHFAPSVYKGITEKNPVCIDYSQTIREALDYLFILNEKMKLRKKDPGVTPN
jgi:hypothetical protein